MAKESYGGRNECTMALADGKRTNGDVGGRPTSYRFLDSSGSSCFSLANSSSFYSPMSAGSGHRSAFNTTTGDHVAGEDVPAVRLFNSSRDGNERIGGGQQTPEAPLILLKSSRARCHHTQPMPSGLGFTTIHTRGSQPHRLSLSDSPLRRDSSATAAAARAESFGMPKPVAKSAEGVFRVSSALKVSGYIGDGLFTSFGQPPAPRLASRFTLMDGVVQKRRSDASGDTGDGAPNSTGAMLASKWPSLTSSYDGCGTSMVKVKAPLSSLKDGALRVQSAPLHANPRDSGFSGANGCAQAVADAARPSSEGTTGAGLSSGCGFDEARLSKSLHSLVASSRAAPQPHCRYSHVDEEATVAALPPPPLDNREVRGSSVARPAPTSTSHTAPDCTHHADRPRSPARLTAEQLPRLSENPLFRRTGVSAAPFAPADWRPAVREQPCSASAADVAAMRRPSVNGFVDSSRYFVQAPARLTFTSRDDRPPSPTYHSGKLNGPPQPSVRFIYTRSGSISTTASPERRTLAPSVEKGSQPPLTVADAAPAAQTKCKEAEDSKLKAASSSHARSTPRRRTVPSSVYEHKPCHPTASTRFTRSATFAGVSKERSAVTRRPLEVRPSQGRQSLAQSTELQASGGQGSRGFGSDFDTAPQSYLMQWRQRQEEKRAREAEAADAKAEVRKASSRASSAMATSSQEAPVTTSTVKDSTSPPLTAASAPNGSWRRAKEEEERDAPAVAPPPSNTVKAETLKRLANTSACTDEVPPAFGVAFSLSEALRSTTLPDTDTTHNEATTAEQSGAAPAPAPKPATAAPAASNSAASKGTAAPLERATVSETVPRVPVESTTSCCVLPHHSAASDPTSFTVPPCSSGGASPHCASGPARRTSQASSGPHLTEEYARREAVDEDIPEDQVLAAAPPTASLGKARTPAHDVSLDSPRKPVKANSDHLRAAANPTTGASAASKPTSAAASTQASVVVSSRRSAVLSSSASGKREEEDREKQGDGTADAGEVRELWRSVLERREQRLQQQREQQQESARRTSAEQATSQLQCYTSPSRSSASLQQPQQLQQLPNTSLTGAPVCENIETHCSSSKCDTASGRCTTASTLSDHPQWRVCVTDSTVLDSRPSSSVPEAAETDAEAAASGTSTTPAARTVTPAAESAHSHISSLPVEADSTTHPKNAPPPSSMAFSSVASSISTAHDGRTAAVVAGAAPVTAAEDEEQKRSRVAQLLARRSSFTHRLSRGIEGTSAPVTSESNAPTFQRETRSEEAALLHGDQISLANDSIVPSACSKNNDLDHDAANAAACAAPRSAFNMTAATQSPPSAADIEREACVAEQRVSAEASRQPSAEPHKDSESKDKAEESMKDETKVNIVAATAASAPPDAHAIPQAGLATRSVTSSVEAKTSAVPLWEVMTDELDKLEQSVNALLENYNKAAAAAHASPVKGGAPSKVTAADVLLSQMPLHVQTTAEKRKATPAAHLSRNNKASKALPTEMSGLCSWHHADDSEWDDEDSHWDASVLWCGEESDANEGPPPTCVPPLDLTALQLPTGDHGDLKPYRIPLPTAVPAPEENHRHLLQLAGVLSSAGALESDHGNDSGGRHSPMGGRNTGVFTGADSFTSSHLNESSVSMKNVSPLLGERIRRMKEQPPEPPAALAAARRLRVSQRAFPATAASGDGAAERNDSPSAQPSEADEEEMVEDSIHEVVDEAPQPISRVTRFTDESDALDGGRGAARDMRVVQQKNRVRMVLLDCEEQRTRKELQAAEQTAFAVVGKSYWRSNRLMGGA